MSSVQDSPQKNNDMAAENTDSVRNNTAKTTEMAAEETADNTKEKGSTPVVPYTGNENLSGGRTRLTAEGEKPV